MEHASVIKRLSTYLVQRPLLLIIAFLSAVFSVLLNVYAPFLIGTILDTFLDSESWKTILVQFILLSFVYLFYSLWTWVLITVTNKIAFASSCELRKKLFSKLEHLPISFYDKNERGDIVSRFINDVDIVSDGLVQSLAILFSGIVTIIAAITFMLTINIVMSVVVMICAPITYFVARMVAVKTQHHFRKQASQVGKLNAYAEEMISGIRSIKAFHHEKQVNEKFRHYNEELYQVGVKAQFFGSLANPSTRLVNNAGYAVVGIIASLLGIKGIISIGQISTFLLYSTLFAKPFNEITSVMTQLQSAVASSKRLFNILDLEEESENDEERDIHVSGEISFVNVSFSYNQQKPLLQNLNIHIPQGSKVAIVGKTGAGKTTLVNLLLRFYDCDKGTIKIDGKDIYAMHRNTLRKCFGMVLQDTFLIKDSIAANIAYGKQNVSREEIITVAKKSGAHKFIQKLSQGYDTILETDDMLSQGQKQLLSITRVLLMNPSILLLDEATSNIDTRNELLITNAMDHIMQGKTSFIIAHRLSTILDADIILVMDHGDIIEQGSHETLIKAKGIYYELYHAQFA